MKIIRNMDNEDSRRFWKFVDDCAAEVATWPAWMKGGLLPEAPKNDMNRSKGQKTK